MNDFITELWFSVPIIYADVKNFDLIQKQIKGALPKVRKTKPQSVWGDTVKTTYTDTGNDLYFYNIGELLNNVETVANQYYAKYAREDITLKVYNSWFNFSEKKDFQFDHVHPGSKVSGVYYYQTNGEDGALVFSNPNIYVSDYLSTFGNPNVEYQPKMGRMILFPSWLRHSVMPNLTNNERISISFNLK